MLEFVHQHTLHAIQSWIGTLPEFLLLQTFAHCIGAIQVLETESSFCLPIVFVLPLDYPMPRYMRGWPVSAALAGIGCTQEYYDSWYSAASTFRVGDLLRPLPPDRDALPLVLWSPPVCLGTKRPWR